MSTTTSSINLASQMSAEEIRARDARVIAFIEREYLRRKSQKLYQRKLEEIALFFRYWKHLSHVDRMKIIQHNLVSLFKHK